MARQIVFPENLDDNEFRPLNAIDIAGQRFGMLVPKAYVGCNKGGAWWYCQCDCGACRIVRAPELRLGRITHCGDKNMHSTTHNMKLAITLFHENVEKNESGCWIWMGARNANGYGLMPYKKGMLAHRFAYMALAGGIPDGMAILHSCDNPPCVNPSHLRPGTAADNSRDKIERNRFSSVLSPEDVVEIKRMLRLPDGARPTQQKIADKYGISQASVDDINRGRTWKHVPWPSERMNVRA